MNYYIDINRIKVGERLRPLDAITLIRLCFNIQRNGQREPILLDMEDNLIDGYHRLEALRALGVQEVLIKRIKV